MRGDYHLGSCEQRGVGAGFGSVDVETRSTNVTGVDGIGQGLFVHQSAAGGVDDDLPFLCLGQHVRVKHACGFFSFGQVDGHKVGAGHEFVERHEFHPKLRRAGRVGVGVVGDDGGFKGREALRKQLADVAEPNDADGLAEDFHAAEGRAFPFAVAECFVRSGDLPGGGEKKGNGVFAGGVDIGGGCVGHHDSAFGGGINVNVVKADACAANDLQFRCCRQHFGVNGGGGSYEEGIGLLDGGEEFGAVWTVYPAHLHTISERVHCGLRELICNEDNRAVILAHVRISWKMRNVRLGCRHDRVDNQGRSTPAHWRATAVQFRPLLPST